MHPHWCFWVKFSWLDKIYLGPISITTRTGPNRPRSHLGLNWAKAGAVSSLLSAPELYQTVSRHYRRKKNTLSVSNTFTQKALCSRQQMTYGWRGCPALSGAEPSASRIRSGTAQCVYALFHAQPRLSLDIYAGVNGPRTWLRMRKAGILTFFFCCWKN